MGRWPLVGAALALTGCSYLVMQRPPVAARPGDSPDCTQSYGWVYADLAIAAAAVLGSAAIYTGIAKHSMTDVNGMTTSTELTTSEREIYGTAALVEAVAFAGSSYYGYWRANQCRAFLAKLAVRPAGPAPIAPAPIAPAPIVPAPIAPAPIAPGATP